MEKIIRITTIPGSLGGLLKGQLKFMSGYYEVVGISSEAKGSIYSLENVGKQEGVRVIQVEMTRQITPVKDLKAIWNLYRILKKEKPFIIHSHTPKAGTIGMIAAYFAGVKNRLHTVAGLPLLVATGKKRKLLDFVEKITYRFATKVYPNSYGMEQIIIDNKYTKRDKLKVLANGSSNGIDTSHFDPALYDPNSKNELRKSLGIDQKDLVYLFVGRIVKDKGINELVNAFDKINLKHSDTKLLLVGNFEKELDPLNSSSMAILENNKNIILTGFQKDVRPYFSISDVLTFPSYREGFPNVVMQAGAMGVPSIVSNINGCNEIITNGKNGYIIPVKNEEALMNQMLHFYKKHRKIEPFDPVTIRNVLTENYEREVVWNALLEEYKHLENANV